MAMGISISFNTKGFETKLRRATEQVKKNVSKTLDEIGKKMVEDIQTNKFSEQKGKYLMYKEGFFHRGVAAALRKVESSLTVGFDKNILDSYTGGAGGPGYWRLFEYGGKTEANPSSARHGGSKTHGFVPAAGKGLYGEGFMSPFAFETHPGVYPTKLFRNTLRGNRMWARERLARSIKLGLKGKNV